MAAPTSTSSTPSKAKGAMPTCAAGEHDRPNTVERLRKHLLQVSAGENVDPNRDASRAKRGLLMNTRAQTRDTQHVDGDANGLFGQGLSPEITQTQGGACRLSKIELDLEQRGLLDTDPGRNSNTISDPNIGRTRSLNSSCNQCLQLHLNWEKSQQTIDELVRQIQGSTCWSVVAPASTLNSCTSIHSLPCTSAEEQESANTRRENKYKRAKEELIISRKECVRLTRVLQQNEEQQMQMKLRLESKKGAEESNSDAHTDAEVEAAQQQLFAYQDQLRGYECSLKRVRDDNSVLRGKLENQQAVNQLWESKSAVHETQITSLETELASMVNAASVNETELKARDQELRDSRHQASILQAAVEELQRTKLSSDARVSMQDTQIAELEAHVASMVNAASVNETELKARDQELQDSRHQASTLKSTVEKMQQNLKAAVAESVITSRREEETAQLHGKLAATLQKLAEKEAEIVALSARSQQVVREAALSWSPVVSRAIQSPSCDSGDLTAVLTPCDKSCTNPAFDKEDRGKERHASVFATDQALIALQPVNSTSWRVQLEGGLESNCEGDEHESALGNVTFELEAVIRQSNSDLKEAQEELSRARGKLDTLTQEIETLRQENQIIKLGQMQQAESARITAEITERSKETLNQDLKELETWIELEKKERAREQETHASIIATCTMRLRDAKAIAMSLSPAIREDLATALTQRKAARSELEVLRLLAEEARGQHHAAVNDLLRGLPKLGMCTERFSLERISSVEDSCYALLEHGCTWDSGDSKREQANVRSEYDGHPEVAFKQEQQASTSLHAHRIVLEENCEFRAALSAKAAEVAALRDQVKALCAQGLKPFRTENTSEAQEMENRLRLECTSLVQQVKALVAVISEGNAENADLQARLDVCGRETIRLNAKLNEFAGMEMALNREREIAAAVTSQLKANADHLNQAQAEKQHIAEQVKAYGADAAFWRQKCVDLDKKNQSEAKRNERRCEKLLNLSAARQTSLAIVQRQLSCVSSTISSLLQELQACQAELASGIADATDRFQTLCEASRRETLRDSSATESLKQEIYHQKIERAKTEQEAVEALRAAKTQIYWLQSQRSVSHEDFEALRRKLEQTELDLKHAMRTENDAVAQNHKTLRELAESQARLLWAETRAAETQSHLAHCHQEKLKELAQVYKCHTSLMEQLVTASKDAVEDLHRRLEELRDEVPPRPMRALQEAHLQMQKRMNQVTFGWTSAQRICQRTADALPNAETCCADGYGHVPQEDKIGKNIGATSLPALLAFSCGFPTVLHTKWEEGRRETGETLWRDMDSSSNRRRTWSGDVSTGEFRGIEYDKEISAMSEGCNADQVPATSKISASFAALMSSVHGRAGETNSNRRVAAVGGENRQLVGVEQMSRICAHSSHPSCSGSMDPLLTLSGSEKVSCRSVNASPCSSYASAGAGAVSNEADSSLELLSVCSREV